MNKHPSASCGSTMWYHPAMAERFAREADITLADLRAGGRR